MSKAREDFPEPEIPVITTSFSLGISISIFFRLWTLAPRIMRLSRGELAAISASFFALGNAKVVLEGFFELFGLDFVLF